MTDRGSGVGDETTPTASAGHDFVPRRAARILLVDTSDRVLMFRGADPRNPDDRYWFTPGGGAHEGESEIEAAVRELAEETGLRVGPEQLGAPVWHESTDFSFDGQWYRQRQQFFLLRVPSWRVDTSGFDTVERATIDEHRWWGVPELETTTEQFFPTELPQLLRRVLDPSAAALGRHGC